MSQPPPRRLRNGGKNIAGQRSNTGHRNPTLGPYVLTRAQCEEARAAFRVFEATHGGTGRVYGGGKTRAAKDRAAAKPRLTPPTQQA